MKIALFLSSRQWYQDIIILMVCSLSEEVWAPQPGSPNQMNYCEKARTHIGEDPFNKSKYVYWLVITAVSTVTKGVKIGNSVQLGASLS